MLDNTGAEFHMLLVARVNDGVTDTADELLALPEEQVSAKIIDVGTAFAAPGATGRTVVNLEAGRYIAVCMLPEGATPENMPAIQSGQLEGTPHEMLGMVREFSLS